MRKTKLLFPNQQMSIYNRIVLVDFYTWFFKSTLSKNIKELNRFNEENIITGQLFSLYRSYKKLLETYLIEDVKYSKNTFIAFVFDRRNSKLLRKRELNFTQYKANRETNYKEYKSQNLFKSQKLFLESVLYYGFYNEYFEADDTISYLVNKLREQGDNLKRKLIVDILTLDSDLIQILDKDDLQIVSDKKEFKRFLFEKDYSKKVLVRFINLRESYTEFLTLEKLKENFNNVQNPKLIFWYKVYFGDVSDNIPRPFENTKRLATKQKIIDYLNENENKFIGLLQFIKSQLITHKTKVNTLNKLIELITQNRELYKELIEKIEFISKRKIDISQFTKNILLILLKDYEIDKVIFTSNLQDYKSGTLKKNYLHNKQKFGFNKIPNFEQDLEPLFNLNTKHLNNLLNVENILNKDLLNIYFDNLNLEMSIIDKTKNNNDSKNKKRIDDLF